MHMSWNNTSEDAADSKRAQGQHRSICFDRLLSFEVTQDRSFYSSRLSLLEGISTPPLEETEEKIRLSIFLKMVQMSIWNSSHTLGLFFICSLSLLLHTQLITTILTLQPKPVNLFFYISPESHLLQAVVISVTPGRSPAVTLMFMQAFSLTGVSVHF